MAAPYEVSSSTHFPVPPEVGYDAILAAPLETIFVDRAGPIPPVKECRGQEGPWSSVGQSRTIVLADGGTVLETLIQADRANRDYRYRLTEVTGALKPLVASVDGRFQFVAEGDGHRATWSWTLHPTNAVTRLLLPVFAIFWRQQAAKMWPRFGARLTA